MQTPQQNLSKVVATSSSKKRKEQTMKKPVFKNEDYFIFNKPTKKKKVMNYTITHEISANKRVWKKGSGACGLVALLNQIRDEHDSNNILRLAKTNNEILVSGSLHQDRFIQKALKSLAKNKTKLEVTDPDTLFSDVVGRTNFKKLKQAVKPKQISSWFDFHKAINKVDFEQAEFDFGAINFRYYQFPMILVDTDNTEKLLNFDFPGKAHVAILLYEQGDSFEPGEATILLGELQYNTQPEGMSESDTEGSDKQSNDDEDDWDLVKLCSPSPKKTLTQPETAEILTAQVMKQKFGMQVLKNAQTILEEKQSRDLLLSFSAFTLNLKHWSSTISANHANHYGLRTFLSGNRLPVLFIHHDEHTTYSNLSTKHQIEHAAMKNLADVGIKNSKYCLFVSRNADGGHIFSFEGSDTCAKIPFQITNGTLSLLRPDEGTPSKPSRSSKKQKSLPKEMLHDPLNEHDQSIPILPKDEQIEFVVFYPILETLP